MPPRHPKVNGVSSTVSRRFYWHSEIVIFKRLEEVGDSGPGFLILLRHFKIDGFRKIPALINV